MHAIWIIFLFAIGACVGSFLNVVIYRLPRGESIVFPGSHCPACGRPIHWYDNIPLLSWLVLKARCRACKAPISPRYLVVEATTAVLVAGLYVGFYVLAIRAGAGPFLDSWPAFLAHAALFCGLLACSIVDIQDWIVPLEVCWFVSVLGAVCAAAAPPPPEFLPRVSPTTGAMALGAGAGLILSLVLLRYGLIQRSFLDAEDKPLPPPAPEDDPAEQTEGGAAPDRDRAKVPAGVALTKGHGVNPRREILREALFLAPAFALAIGARLLVTRVEPAAAAWARVAGPDGGWWSPHVAALLASLFGYLVGGLWIWAMRILGTLGFGKEAMGLGDVHILAAVGAVCGWVVPSMAFFLSAFLAMAWAISIYVFRRQRELPYGPWLAGGALVAVLFHDRIAGLLQPQTQALRFLWERWTGT